MDHRFFATAPRHTEELVASELESFGARDIATKPAGVGFGGSIEVAYRACLWSRVANRILMPLLECPADSPKALYEAARTVAWIEHMRLDTTFAIDAVLSSSQVQHSVYAAQVVKDALVDTFRDAMGERPSVDRENPDLRFNLHISQDQATISLDLSGGSLHERGYRVEAGAAPLKENVAAAMLLRARWPELAAEGRAFVDPMCGSGTLPIEAALIAADMAPGTFRRRFGFQSWRSHDRGIWRRLREEAKARADQGIRKNPLIFGSDMDNRVVEKARANVDRAGLRGVVRISERELSSLRPPEGPPGLVAVNPPYGRRLGSADDIAPLYAELGRIAAERFPGWSLAVLAGSDQLARAVGLRARRVHSLDNGPVACRLAHFDLGAPAALPRASQPAGTQVVPPSTRPAPRIRVVVKRPERPAPVEVAREPVREPIAPGPGAEMFANRLKKNMGHLSGWVRKEKIHCYRVYDQDMPEYKVAIDIFEEKWAHVQEYAAPRSIEPEAAQRRFDEILHTVPRVLGIKPENLFVRQRRKQGRYNQYERLARQGVVHRVREEDYVFLVNFTDYLDTGLFLDHRITRQMIRDLAVARPFLNLFAYTGTATVAAARGGATRSISVDTSNTYLEWARQNFDANGLTTDEHRLVRADCRDFLERDNGRYGLIFIDPPTFSNSKRRREDFDIQVDYGKLIHSAARLLAPEGVIVFSNNYSRFRLDEGELRGFRVTDISAETIPRDFKRNERIHHCFLITN